MHFDEVELANFIKGDVDENEFERITNHLEECDECRKKYQTLLVIRSFQREIEEENFKFRRVNRFYLIAASVVIFLTGALFITSLFLKSKFKENYVSFLEKESFPYRGDVVRGGEKYGKLKDIMKFYEEKRYDRFIEEMEKYLKNNSLDSRHYFYLGVSCYIKGRYSEAEKYLRLSTYNYSIKIYPERFWYLSNVLLREKKFKEGVVILKKLSKFKNPYMKRARKLLSVVE